MHTQINLELDNLEHTVMLFFAVIYALSGIVIDLYGLSDELSSLIGLLLASTFANELFLVHLHSSDHVGLEGHYHWLLQLVLVVSLVTTIHTSFITPASSSSSSSCYVSAIVRSMSIMAQGLWLMVMGFVLYVPKYISEGCYVIRTVEGGRVIGCKTEMEEKRGIGMANLQFSFMVVGINVFVLMVSLWEWKGNACFEYKRIQCGGVFDDQVVLVHQET
ncbi:Cobalamin adenosyltransferase-like protein [Dioscorea alata]|uniref:Cobalamin adenosyltransferase-like protein n=1 Tax=Dioscorea alata TaxID=55571 RepID=A0ACB7VYN0_DIOAL|nr:Cobalamin adenosyltransferase-like protein [Dioscorea alata]